jgi:hypothetical protein
MAPDEHMSDGDDDYKMEDAEEEGATFELPEVRPAAQTRGASPAGGLGAARRGGWRTCSHPRRLLRIDRAACAARPRGGRPDMPPGRSPLQSSRRELEEQEKLIQEFELRRKVKSVVVPTDDAKVKQMLRALKEPITLFGERQVRRPRPGQLPARAADH